MKTVLTIILLFVYCLVAAQRNVHDNARDLDIALVERDTVFLKQYLHEKLSYGHSNGWVETKNALISHLFNGKLRYKTIRSENVTEEGAGNTVIRRSESHISYILDGREGELKMHVLQVWVLTDKGWQLLGRQSTKIN